MEPKKISFGFSKISKLYNSNILNRNVVKEEVKVELIKCVEDQSIIPIADENKKPEIPLIIPMIEGSRTTAALASLKLREKILNGIEESEDKLENRNLVDNKIAFNNESIEERAARELLQDLQQNNNETEEDSTLTVPIKPDELPLTGAIEPTLDDYDQIPINQFGVAMLRGMGWSGDLKKKTIEDADGPFVRPKGMGLGADKATKPKALLIPPEQNEVLEIKKNAFVRILAGKHKDLYGQIQGLDDHAGRVIVKMALGSGHESLNEFLVQPVSKKEYAKYSKVLNSAKYEQYKEIQAKQEKIQFKEEQVSYQISSDEEEKKVYVKSQEHRHLSAHKSRKNRSPHSSLDKYSSRHRDSRHKNIESKSYHSKYKSRDRNSSGSENDRRSRHKKKSKKKKSHKKYSSSSSSSEDDRHHTKKTKKSKKPRSRSRERR